MKQNLNFVVGGSVMFRQTTGEHITGRARGIVLAIGASAEWSSSRVVDGAIVAWEADKDGPARVSFTPFYNSRFTALPEPEIVSRRSRSRRQACRKVAFMDDPMTQAYGVGSEMVEQVHCTCPTCR